MPARDLLAAAVTNLRTLERPLGILHRPLLAAAIEQIEQARAELARGEEAGKPKPGKAWQSRWR